MASLTKYNRKRDFTQTSEPSGKLKRGEAKKLQFVIQKHDASHLHYDFRLEMGGALKSWAVPKGPSLNPRDKRLAMMTEDHPFDYRKFEGEIPKGNYGAGEVIVWDNGTYEMVNDKTGQPKDPLEYLEKGHLDFVLHGQKLQGRFTLVKKGKQYEDNAWLLIKTKDEFAGDDDITELVESVLSNKVLTRDKPAGHDLLNAPPTAIPKVVKPMLATLVSESFDDDDWLYEIKWDGYRALASWDGAKARLYSRNNKDFSAKYPPIYEAVRQLNQKVVLDGEIVAADEHGRSNFTWLQNYGNAPQGQLLYFVFDILWCDGHDVRDWPLIRRKELLKQVVGDNARIRYSDHIVGKGKEFFDMAKQRQLEGMMAKRCDSRYIEGYRSKLWLKVKTHLRQEVVIGGFTEPRGSRKHLGSLLAGVYQGRKFKYAGHVGGVPPKQLADLRARLEKLERQTSPFSEKVKANAPVHWVEPEQLAEVTFTEWTHEGHMRHPIFVGLRTDKAPKKVHKELPKEVNMTKSAESRVKFTHKDKIFWPDLGLTKGDLLDYYMSVSETILPYIKDRPESLLRHPNGIDGKSFFQKDSTGRVPDWAHTIKIYSESNEKDIEYFVAENTEDLELLVQLGCIEINPWSSRTNALDKPDWAVIDLDPEGVEFKDVVRVALEVKKLCGELKIPSYPKTSGKTGIHIFIPTAAKYTYDQVKTFAEILANIIQSRTGDITSVVRTPSKRQHKIYIDFLQNRRGQTLAAPYSVRPTKEASVSAPLHWDEVDDMLHPANFTVKNMPTRLKNVGDIWQPVVGKGIDLQKAIDNLS